MSQRILPGLTLHSQQVQRATTTIFYQAKLPKGELHSGESDVNVYLRTVDTGENKK